MKMIELSLLKSFVMESGERYCLLINANTGIPLYYPNLYITTQLRNKSLSYSTMESSLSGIAVLLKFLAERDENLEQRFRNSSFFNDSELDAIRDYCQKKFRTTSIDFSSQRIIPLVQHRELDNKVRAETEYVRLTVIAQFTKWLAELLISSKNDKNTQFQIEKMKKGFESRRPVKKNRNSEFNLKGLTKEQLGILFEVFRPDSEVNPFIDKNVGIRNRLIFLLLYHLGLRGGELLNIKIKDIDFGKNHLLIARRADDKSDPRKYQPLVKTLDRKIPVKDILIQELHSYITIVRRKIPNASKHDFLFVTHKSGPSQGQPLSKSGYKKILAVIRNVSPTLFNFTGHQLRHSWNEVFSDYMDSMDQAPSSEEQEKIRSFLMGWREGSGTASIYNKRFIRKKAYEAALNIQNGMVRLPKGSDDE